MIRSPSPQLVPFKLHRFGQQRHGDHYSFNSDEFVQWCEQDAHQTLSLDQANHELAPFCIRVGYAEPVRSWRYYLT
nr:hypothetical protein [Aeromonas caviae]